MTALNELQNILLHARAGELEHVIYNIFMRKGMTGIVRCSHLGFSDFPVHG